jgi:hypothetical protein
MLSLVVRQDISVPKQGAGMYMPGSQNTPICLHICISTCGHVAFRKSDSVGTQY